MNLNQKHIVQNLSTGEGITPSKYPPLSEHDAQALKKKIDAEFDEIDALIHQIQPQEKLHYWQRIDWANKSPRSNMALFNLESRAIPIAIPVRAIINLLITLGNTRVAFIDLIRKWNTSDSTLLEIRDHIAELRELLPYADDEHTSLLKCLEAKFNKKNLRKWITQGIQEPKDLEAFSAEMSKTITSAIQSNYDGYVSQACYDLYTQFPGELSKLKVEELEDLIGVSRTRGDIHAEIESVNFTRIEGILQAARCGRAMLNQTNPKNSEQRNAQLNLRKAASEGEPFNFQVMRLGLSEEVCSSRHDIQEALAAMGITEETLKLLPQSIQKLAKNPQANRTALNKALKEYGLKGHQLQTLFNRSQSSQTLLKTSDTPEIIAQKLQDCRVHVDTDRGEATLYNPVTDELVVVGYLHDELLAGQAPSTLIPAAIDQINDLLAISFVFSCGAKAVIKPLRQRTAEQTQAEQAHLTQQAVDAAKLPESLKAKTLTDSQLESVKQELAALKQKFKLLVKAPTSPRKKLSNVETQDSPPRTPSRSHLRSNPGSPLVMLHCSPRRRSPLPRTPQGKSTPYNPAQTKSTEKANTDRLEQQLDDLRQIIAALGVSHSHLLEQAQELDTSLRELMAVITYGLQRPFTLEHKTCDQRKNLEQGSLELHNELLKALKAAHQSLENAEINYLDPFAEIVHNINDDVSSDLSVFMRSPAEHTFDALQAYVVTFNNADLHFLEPLDRFLRAYVAVYCTQNNADTEFFDENMFELHELVDDKIKCLTDNSGTLVFEDVVKARRNEQNVIDGQKAKAEGLVQENGDSDDDGW